MSTPQGFNPVGDHAPGLPRHDAGLPGHVSGGGFANIGGGGEDQWFVRNRVGDPGLPPIVGIWFGRVALYACMYILLPVQMALYPIAGAVALGAGLVSYLALSIVGMGYDSKMDWVWMIAFIGLVASMRTEIGYEASHPTYRDQRHWARLGLLFLAMIYMAIHEQHESFGMALLLGAVMSVAAHFILRQKMLRMIWDGLQILGWLRPKPPEPEPATDPASA
jgi:hypothetical protein